MKKYIYLLGTAAVIIAAFIASQSLQSTENSGAGLKTAERAAVEPSSGEASKGHEQPLITFVELGSLNCIPCKKMQPVMKSIEEKYSGQVEVIFHDVWKPDQKKYAREYNVISIPTQVFLDSKGVEIARHIGFYPEEEIDKFLQSHGLNPVQ